MPALRYKAFAYITHGDRLLVFSHPDSPSSGIQVPAGTIEDGERPDEAVMREAHEDTGRTDLELVRFLGELILDRPDFGLGEVHHRYFYHLRYTGDPPATWLNREPDPSDGGPEQPLFEFFWSRLPHDVPELITDHGVLLPRLVEQLSAEGLLEKSSPLVHNWWRHHKAGMER